MCVSPVAPSSPWLVGALGAGEGRSCLQARVEVRVDGQAARGGGRGTGVRAAAGLPGAGWGRLEGDGGEIPRDRG